MSVAQRAKGATKRALQVMLRPFVFRYRQLFATTQRAAEQAEAARGSVLELSAQLRADAEIMGEFSRLARRVVSDVEQHVEDLRALRGHEPVGRSTIDAPFAFGALSALPAGSAVLVLAARVDTLALSLASLGYKVTAHDAEPLAVRHPNLSIVACPIDVWPGPDHAVDAVVALEHFDRALLDRARGWLRPGGRLVAAVPLGSQSDALFDGWRIEVRRDFVQHDHRMWTELPSVEASARVERDGGVALVVATPA